MPNFRYIWDFADQVDYILDKYKLKMNRKSFLHCAILHASTILMLMSPELCIISASCMKYSPFLPYLLLIDTLHQKRSSSCGKRNNTSQTCGSRKSPITKSSQAVSQNSGYLRSTPRTQKPSSLSLFAR